MMRNMVRFLFVTMLLAVLAACQGEGESPAPTPVAARTPASATAPAADAPAAPTARARQALWFDGNDDFLQTGAWLSQPTEGFCLEAWFNPAMMNPFNSYSAVLAYRAGAHDKFIRYNCEKNEYSFAGGHPAAQPVWLGSAQKVRRYGWRHVAVSGDGRTVTLYVDGEAVATTSTTAAQDWSAGHIVSFIGGDFLPGASLRGGFRGQIDELRVWSVARSAEEIRATMRRIVAPDTPGLAAYWDFDEVDGQICRDVSGHNRDGVLGARPEPGPDDPMRIPSDCPAGLTAGEGGAAGYALWFHGQQSYVRTAPLAGLQGAGALTCEAWIRPAAPMRPGCLVAAEGPGTERSFRVIVEAEGILKVILRTAQGERVFRTTGRVKPNVWQHMAFATAGRTIEGYIDGAPASGGGWNKGPQMGGLALQGTALTIGAAADGSLPFTGEVDEVRIWSVARSAQEIDAASHATVSRAATGLLSCWRLDEADGQAVLDGGPARVHGQLGYNVMPDGNDPVRLLSTAPIREAATEAAPAPPSQGTALSFDGVDDQVVVGNPADLRITGPFSVEAWVRLDSDVLGEKPIVSKQNSTMRQNTFELQMNQGRVRFRVSDGSAGCCGDPGWTPVEGKTVVQPGTWHHVAGVWDGKQIAVYLDGLQEATYPFDKRLSTVLHPVLIGKNAFVQQKMFKGQLDELRIWNRARTQEELLAGMNRGLRGDEPELIGYWTFDDAAGEAGLSATPVQAILDGSGHNHHGVLGSSVQIEANDPKWVLSEAPIVR